MQSAPLRRLETRCWTKLARRCIMMRGKVTRTELDDLLRGLGFIIRVCDESHVVYVHSARDVEFVIPAVFRDDIVAMPHLVSIRKVLAEKGVLRVERFDAWLHGKRSKAVPTIA